ncbi:VWA domain-containing protein, partial [Rhizobium leguminosarum]
LYQAALRKPSLTALCLDFSGSMQGDGEDQLQKAMRFLLTPDEASKVLVQWSPADQIIVIPFDGSVRNTFMASGNPLEQEGLLNEISRQKADGGTNMYACAERALQQITRTDRLSTYLPAIVIMTDGKSDDQSQAFMR